MKFPYRLPRWLKLFYPRAEFSLPGPAIALTFDDGPDETWTPRILDVLDEAGIKATFFLVGRQAAAYPGLVRDIAGRGHGLGSHYQVHTRLKRIAEVTASVKESLKVLEDITGSRSRLVRPPFGLMPRRAMRSLHEEGYRIILWDVMPYDFRCPGPEKIITRTVNAVRPGSIIILHDGGGDRSRTVAALPGMGQRLSERYEFVLLDRC